MSSTDHLAEIQARIPALYKGPWSVSWADGDGENTPDRWVVSYPTDNPLAGLVAEVADYGAELADFIAHARTDVPWLVAELAEALAKLRVAEKHVTQLDDANAALTDRLLALQDGNEAAYRELYDERRGPHFCPDRPIGQVAAAEEAIA